MRVGALGWATVVFVAACSLYVSWQWIKPLAGLWGMTHGGFVR